MHAGNNLLIKKLGFHLSQQSRYINIFLRLFKWLPVPHFPYYTSNISIIRITTSLRGNYFIYSGTMQAWHAFTYKQTNNYNEDLRIPDSWGRKIM